MARVTAKRRDLSVDDYYAGVRAGDVAILARALTLIESSSPRHQPKSRLLDFVRRRAARHCEMRGEPAAAIAEARQALSLEALTASAPT